MKYTGMKSLRLLVGDPGRSTDPFGVIGMEATYPEKIIHIRHARQFKNIPYSTIARHFSKMSKLIKPHMILIEKNFDYDNVSKAFTHLPVKYITTGTGLTEQTRAKGWSVDKPYMVGWLKQQYKKHTIQLPSNPTEDMKELINQRNQIVGITAPSGHVSYKAQRNRHDDLWMAELIGSNAVRIWWEQCRTKK